MRSDHVPLIELKQVSKTFGTPVAEHSVQHLLQRLHLTRPRPVTHAVDRVDLRINRSEVVGLVGESGCGKSTLGRMVAGLLPVSSGTALVDGKSLGNGRADCAGHLGGRTDGLCAGGHLCGNGDGGTSMAGRGPAERSVLCREPE